MINPLGRAYQGYAQANQSLVEEEDENGNAETEEDLEAGHTNANMKSTIFQNTTKSQSQRRVSFDAGASEMNVLRPNIHQEDKIHEHDSSDDEVPQSFMIEASSRKPSSSPGCVSNGKERSSRTHPLHSAPGRASLRPVLPTIASVPSRVSIPPRPSELNTEDATQSEPSERQPKQMRGLDAYERALWNWVNVYNLDAYLQEVYYYYEGKGIYSIALARGLNLLLVTWSSRCIFGG